MFCESCGAKIGDDARFCGGCGAAIDGGARPDVVCDPAASALPSCDPRLVGFSQKMYDLDFERARAARFRKEMSTGVIFLFVVVLLFQIAPFFSEDFTRPIALAVGCIVGGFGLVCTLVGGAMRAWASTWDGEVVNKTIVKHQYSNRPDKHHTHTYYLHTIFFRLANGGRKKMRRKLHSSSLNAWNMMTYLGIGDQVRYHGKLDYYEKYDKSRDAQIPCAVCGKFVDIRPDRCPHCQAPLLKP